MSFTIERPVNGVTVAQRFEGRVTGEQLADMTVAEPAMPEQRLASRGNRSIR